MLEGSWDSFISIIAVPVLLPDLNPWRMSCIFRVVRRRVSINASTTFHSVSNRPMTLVLVLPFGIRTIIVHPNSWGVSPGRHM